MDIIDSERAITLIVELKSIQIVVEKHLVTFD